MVANTPGHMTNSRKFDLKELRLYRVCCPNSMDQTSGLEKYPKHQETKDFYIIYRSERLEGKEEYIELSESYKVSEFVGCN